MVGGRLAVHSKLYRHIVFNIKIELQFYYLPTLLKKSFRLKKTVYSFSLHTRQVSCKIILSSLKAVFLENREKIILFLFLFNSAKYTLVAP